MGLGDRPMWPRRKLRSIAYFMVLGCLGFVFSLSPKTSLATILQIAGTYTGQINGFPVQASASGFMDTTGISLAHTTITFSQIPPNFNPIVAGNSWNSSRSVSGVQRSDPVAVNLFDISGGNYLASRTDKWSSLPGEQIVFTSNVSTIYGVMTANTTVNGTYTGPSDVVGVTN